MQPNFFLSIFFTSLLCLYLAACDTSLEHGGEELGRYEFLALDNYQIPKLEDAKQQLAYGLSSFETSGNKLAALKAVSYLFPEKNLETGLAALEICYLNLGQDFRLTSKNEIEQAVQNYGEIAEEYRSFPQIVAKALWYQGWIYSDLLNDFNSGKEKYKRIIEQFPEQKVRLHPPPPWLSLHSDDLLKTHKPFFSKSKLTWAALAWLEILRHTNTEQNTRVVFTQLQKHDTETILLVPAIRILVNHYGLTQNLEAMIREYLQEQCLDKDLRQDLVYLLTENKK